MVVKLAASIVSAPSAMRHNTEFDANARSASEVNRKMRKRSVLASRVAITDTYRLVSDPFGLFDGQFTLDVTRMRDISWFEQQHVTFFFRDGFVLDALWNDE